MEIGTKAPPHNDYAEQSVLGCLLKDNSLIKDIWLTIDAGDFYRKKNQQIFKAIMDIHKAGGVADVITIGERLSKGTAGVADSKISEFLDSITKGITATISAAISYHAQILHQKKMLRELLKAGHQVVIKAYDGTQSPEEIVQELRADVNDIQKNIISEEFNLHAELKGAYAELDEFSKDGSARILTGFRDVDRLLGSIKRKRTYMIAGLPSMGKTSFMIQLMQNIAEQEHLVLYITVEMSNREILFRAMQPISMVPNERFENPKLLQTEDWAAIGKCIEGMKDLPIVLNDSTYTLDAMWPLVEKYKPAVTIVDFIDGMDFGGVVDRAPKIAKAISDFKRMAKQLNTAVIIASQINREKEGCHIDTYELSDLKGSGGKEIGVDVVIFIHYPYQDKKEEHKMNVYTGKPWVLPRDMRMFYVKLKKNKFLKRGRVLLYFVEEHGTFKDWSFREENA